MNRIESSRLKPLYRDPFARHVGFLNSQIYRVLSLIRGVEDGILVFQNFKDVSIALNLLNNQPKEAIADLLLRLPFNSLWLAYEEICNRIFVDNEHFSDKALLEANMPLIRNLGDNIIIGNGVTQPLIQLSENDPNLCKLLNLRGELKVGKYVIKFGNNKVLNLMSNSSGGEVLGTEKKINFENPSSCGCCSGKSDILPGNADSVNIDRDRYFDFNDSRGPEHHGLTCWALRVCSSKGHMDNRNLELWFGYKMFMDPNNHFISMSTLNAVAKGFRRKKNGSNGVRKDMYFIRFETKVLGGNKVNAWGYTPNGTNVPLGKSGVGSFSYSERFGNNKCFPSQEDELWCNIVSNIDEYNCYVPSLSAQTNNIGIDGFFSIVHSDKCIKFDLATCKITASFNKDKGPVVDTSCQFYW